MTTRRGFLARVVLGALGAALASKVELKAAPAPTYPDGLLGELTRAKDAFEAREGRTAEWFNCTVATKNALLDEMRREMMFVPHAGGLTALEVDGMRWRGPGIVELPYGVRFYVGGTKRRVMVTHRAVLDEYARLGIRP